MHQLTLNTAPYPADWYIRPVISHWTGRRLNKSSASQKRRTLQNLKINLFGSGTAAALPTLIAKGSLDALVCLSVAKETMWPEILAKLTHALATNVRNPCLSLPIPTLVVKSRGTIVIGWQPVQIKALSTRVRRKPTRMLQQYESPNLAVPYSGSVAHWMSSYVHPGKGVPGFWLTRCCFSCPIMQVGRTQPRIKFLGIDDLIQNHQSLGAMASWAEVKVSQLLVDAATVPIGTCNINVITLFLLLFFKLFKLFLLQVIHSASFKLAIPNVISPLRNAIYYHMVPSCHNTTTSPNQSHHIGRPKSL